MTARSEASNSWLNEDKVCHNLFMRKLWTGCYTKHRLQFHPAWIPKNRKGVLRGKIAIRLKRQMYEACRMNRWRIDELSIQVYHVHVMIQIKPRESVAEVVQILKGGTSCVLRKEFPGLEELLWGDSFWADGYFAETVGKVDEEIVRKYIREQ